MICYYLKGKNGEYIARDPTGRIKLVSDLADALLVPEIEKKKIKAIQANNIPDVLKKFGPYEICETDYNGVEAITTDDIVGEIIGSINEFSSKMNEITDYSKELNSYVFKAENDTYTYREKNRTVIIGREQVELLSIREA